MSINFRSFFRCEDGTITFDWVVLTGVILGTGMAITGSVTRGIESASLGTTSQLRGQVIRQSFGANLCSTGIDGLRDREAARIASGGSDPVDIADWMATYGDTLSDMALLSERDRLVAANRGIPNWTRNKTIQSLMECSMTRRGLG